MISNLVFRLLFILALYICFRLTPPSEDFKWLSNVQAVLFHWRDCFDKFL